MSSKLIAIIAGVGPGTGTAIARKFAATYPVALLARNPENFEKLVDEINKGGGQAIGISTDVSDSKSVTAAFDQIRKRFGEDVGAAAAVFNASGPFSRKPFLEVKEEEFRTSLGVSVTGAFLFSQSALPLLLKPSKSSPASSTETPQHHPPTLIFTGATASIKANAQVGTFASGKFALRALSASLAKEFGPQGVHVSHAIIDGVIDIPKTKDYLKDAGPDAKIDPQAIADEYWRLHTQVRSAWSWEIDLRPWIEKF